MNNAITKTMKTLVNNNKNIYDIVYNGINHNHRKQIAQFVANEVNTLKQFVKTDFNYCGELSLAKRMAIEVLQEKLIKYMNKTKVADTNKNVREAKSAVAKVIKKQAAKRKAKKVAKKTAVTKKKTTKQTILDKYTKQYSIVTAYSDNLLQDVYSVVYKGNVLKRFVNENLANKYIGQEVLVKVGEHNIRTAKKTKALNAELSAEFEG
jgi:hypothetical protein